MKSFRLLFLLLSLVLLFSSPGGAWAQVYSLSVPQMDVNVYWNADGSATIDYVFVFANDPGASPLDYVDVGMPNSNFSEGNITADVNGTPVYDISKSGFQGKGVGVAVGLGGNAIQPGRSGRVHVNVGRVEDVLHPDSQDDSYASSVFSPTWFDSSYVHGDTAMTVTYHLPPGVTPQEPRWHEAPSGFPAEPATGIDQQGRVTYTWRNDFANSYTQYKFGASFPSQYVPAGAIVKPSFTGSIGIDAEDLFTFFWCGFFILIFLISPVFNIVSSRRRRMQYLPPKIAIEGHGIKRGLTSIEAAVLLEQPLDKIMTMILFSVIKKSAAEVVTRDPLELSIAAPPPEGLYPYEVDFLTAFKGENKKQRRRLLQDMTVNLVKSVANKMKGFSRNETIAYYRDIVNRAWGQVEAAATPEVKSEKFDEVMEWTMLDRNYDDRTRDIFRTGPVFVPTWWGRYDPGFGRSVTSAPSTTSLPTSMSGGGKVSMPTLPGSTFAAGIVNGVQNFSAGVIGNVADFTSGVTNKTNPVPVSTRSYSGGGGGGCACACACAGCACACAGGGR